MKCYLIRQRNSITILLYLILTTGNISLAQVQNKVAINEMISSNRSGAVDEDGEFHDWIELYNYGDSIVNLSGWGLSDDTLNPFRWVFPDFDMQPNDYLVVWASGKNKVNQPLEHKIFIPENSEWKYLDDGSNQGTAWREQEFNDSLWNSGPGMLGYDTKFSTLFGTVLDFGNSSTYKHLTYYFRNTFEITDTSRYKDLELRLMVDDGAVVYLNGYEVARVNMPGGEITHDVPANVIVGTLDISHHEISSSLLLNGTNTLAVEVHQCNRTSSDMRFDLEFVSKGRNLHTNFSISSQGEDILLTHPISGLVDRLDSLMLPSDVSIGRWPDGTGDYAYYSAATPGQPNPEERFMELLPPPVFSHAAGFYASPFNLSLSSLDSTATIIYTIDGSEPHIDNLGGGTFEFKNNYPGSLNTASFGSFIYADSIYLSDRTPEPEYLAGFSTDYNGSRYTSTTNRLFKGTVIRARAFREGAISGDESIHTYFFNSALHNRYDFPILSVTIDPRNMFEYSSGFYTPGKVWDEQANGTKNGGAPANYNRRDPEWEKFAYLEFFDGQATNPVLSQHVGIKTHGAWSRAHAMKSLRLYARNAYGEDYFNHQIFPDLPYNRYKRFVLRNSGNDWGRTNFLDAAAHRVFDGMLADIQAYRPVILFLNGEYWGIHNARERLDKYYLNRRYGIDSENIDFIAISSGQAEEGDRLHYDNLITYLENNNLAATGHYRRVQTYMDTDNFIDYQIAHIYIANTDWPGNNNSFWRLKTAEYLPYAPKGHDGRWRWLIFDTDFGFGGINNAYHNTLNHATSPTLIWQNPPHSTLILRRLLLNEEFNRSFINRFADLLNTHFVPTRVNGIVKEIRDLLQPEMPEHINRWRRPGSISGWQSNVNNMNAFANTRPTQVRQHIQNHFNISGQVNLNVNVSDPTRGHVKVNTIEILSSTPGISDNPYPWTGIYFHDIPIKLEAISKPGYIFSHWDGIENMYSSVVSQAFSGISKSIKAHFTQSEIVQSWNFNSLPNTVVEYLQSDLSHNEVGIISYPGYGNGFMDRLDEGTMLNATGETPAGYALRVRNPSRAKELLIEAPTTGFKNIAFSYATMRSPNGAIFQEIQYRTKVDGLWTRLVDPVPVSEEWTTHRINISVDEANNNPQFALRILFKGPEAENETGNNRFDNIRIEGMDITTSINDSDEYIQNNDSVLFNVWHSEGRLNLFNPFSGKSILSIYGINGNIIAQYDLDGLGNHTMAFTHPFGIYIARLVSSEVVANKRFMVRN
jgi:hypothetical protein